MGVYIEKGGKKLSSIYLNDLGYKLKWLGKGQYIEKVAFHKIFVFRESSWILFESVAEANKTLDNAIKSISEDERYSDSIKKSLIKSVNGLRKHIVVK